MKLPGVDVVCDIEDRLPFKDNTVDGIRVIQVLEHVRDLIFVLEEFWRVCKEFIRPTKKKFWAYIWETLKDKFANRFPDIYENTWLKIFSARHLEVRLIVRKDENKKGIISSGKNRRKQRCRGDDSQLGNEGRGGRCIQII